MTTQQCLEQIEYYRQLRAEARRAYDVDTVIACTVEIGKLSDQVRKLQREQEQ